MHRRTISTITLLLILCALPQEGLYAVSAQQEISQNLLIQSEQDDTDQLANTFASIADSVEESDEKLEQVRAFFRSFIEETNKQYGLALTPVEVCNMMRQNLDQLDIPFEDRDAFLLGLELIESDESSHFTSLGNKHPFLNLFHFSWPWEWNWFGWNKKNQTDEKAIEANQLGISGETLLVFILLCTTGVTLSLLNPASTPVIMTSLAKAATSLCDP